MVGDFACTGERTGKAGDRDRTDDIQLGNMNVPPSNTVENKAFSTTPSSIPSSVERGPAAKDSPELSKVVAAWNELPPAVRTVLVAAVESITHPTPK